MEAKTLDKEKWLSAREIRKVPRQERARILREMTIESMPYYHKYKEELASGADDALDDGID